jgi:GTP cyclohydrolase I
MTAEADPRFMDPALLSRCIAEAQQGIRAVLRMLGEDPDRAGLEETPRRWLNAYMELGDRTGDPATLLGKVFQDVTYPTDQMIAVGPIPFTSLCEHHLLPFQGTAWVAYLPSVKGVVGLSKIPRLVDHFARRPQVQERLTNDIVAALDAHLAPDGAACIIRARHECMSIRGVRKEGTDMVTSVLTGSFKQNPTVRAEFLALTR